MTTFTLRRPLRDARAVVPSTPALRVLGVPAWILFVGVALTVMVGYLTVLTPMRASIYPAFSLATAGLFAVGLVKTRPDRALAFWLLFGGVLVSALADVTYFVGYPVVLGVDTPFPSAADALYLAAPVLWSAGFVVLTRGRRIRRDIGGWIDTAMVVTALGLLEFVFIVYPNLSTPGAPLVSRLIAIAYPLGDMLILGLLARLLVSPGARTFAFWALVAGFGVRLIVNALYSFLLLEGMYEPGLIDLGWLGGYALLAVAVLHPSLRTLAQRVPDFRPNLSWFRLIALTALALVGPGLFVYLAPRVISGPVFVAVSIGCGVMFLLVIARMAGLVRRLNDSMSALKGEQAARGELLRRTLWASEQDRNRVASELHDGPVQQLTALAYRLEALRGKVAKDGSQAADGFETIQHALSLEISDLRRTMTTLRPGSLIERGLEATVADHLAASVKGRTIRSHLAFDLPCRPAPEVETVIYRVVQGSVANAVKHSSAASVDVSLTEREGDLQLLVIDNGNGFDLQRPDGPALGLEGMRERVEMMGGTFSVSSAVGAGTTVEARIPMEGTWSET